MVGDGDRAPPDVLPPPPHPAAATAIEHPSAIRVRTVMMVGDGNGAVSAHQPRVPKRKPPASPGETRGYGSGDKPSSVRPNERPDGHLSGTVVADRLEQPTRGFTVSGGIGAGRTSPPIWPCSDWGLPCRSCYQKRGGLLPHHFTLTPLAQGGLFSVVLSVASRRPGVTWQSALWSSDFPRKSCPSRDHRALPVRER